MRWGLIENIRELGLWEGYLDWFFLEKQCENNCERVIKIAFVVTFFLPVMVFGIAWLAGAAFIEYFRQVWWKNL